MKQFENVFIYQNKKVRTLTQDGDVWFVAKDVCDVLEYKNSRDALQRLDKDEKGVALNYSLGGKQRMAHINEFGLYSLILGSRKAEARQFKRWVTHEVLPSIRVNGGYFENSNEPFDPDWRGYAMRQLTMENDLLRGDLSRYDDLFDNTKNLAETMLKKAVAKAEEVKKTSVVRGVRIDRRGTTEILREME